MAYILTDGGSTALAYPYSQAQLQRDNPDISFPRNMSDEQLALWYVFPVVPTAKPAEDINFSIVEDVPVLNGSDWTQVWAQVPASAEEIALRTQRAWDAEHAATVKADTFVQNFIGMTPAQVEAYIDANTASLAEVRSLLKKMGAMLLILARRQFRN